MDTTGREIKDVTGLDLMVCKDIGDGTVCDTALVFLGGDLLPETGIEVTTLIGLDDIPHLGLAHLAMFAHGHLVIGMYLYAQVFPGINELHQQGKLTLVFLIDRLSQNGIGMLADNGNQISACPHAIADDASAGGDCADLPALADGLVGGLQTFIGA